MAAASKTTKNAASLEIPMINYEQVLNVPYVSLTSALKAAARHGISVAVFSHSVEWSRQDWCGSALCQTLAVRLRPTVEF